MGPWDGTWDGTLGWYPKMVPWDGTMGWYPRMVPQDGTLGWYPGWYPTMVPWDHFRLPGEEVWQKTSARSTLGLRKEHAPKMVYSNIKSTIKKQMKIPEYNHNR